MRRNCPHCGADQVVADEKLTAGWVFLKCHHCAVISPVHGRAAQALAQAFEKPLRTLKPVAAPVEAIEPEAPIADEPRIDLIKPILTLPPVPEFLKSEPVKGPEKIPEQIDEPLVFEPETSSDAQPVPVLLEEELPVERFEFAKTWGSRFRPYALPLVLALICFASGGYLIRSARLIRQGGWAFSTDVVPVVEPITQTSEPVQAAKPAAPVVASVAAERVPAQAPVAAAAITHSRENEKRVEVLAASAVLRAGPGTQYGKVGTARAELQLWVKGSFDNWIEVRTEGGAKTAWIRSDLVKPLKQVAQQEAQPSLNGNGSGSGYESR